MAWDANRKLLNADNLWVGDQTIQGKIICSLWNHISVPLESGKTPASGYPTWTKIRDDGSGSIGLYGWSFADDEYIWASVVFPHDYKSDTTIYPRVYYMCLTDVNPADNFKIGLEYAWGQETSYPANSTIITQEISTGVNTAYDAQEIDLGSGISGTGHIFGENFNCRIFRAAGDSDNYAGGVVITDLVINFEIDCFGTYAKASK